MWMICIHFPEEWKGSPLSPGAKWSLDYFFTLNRQNKLVDARIFALEYLAFRKKLMKYLNDNRLDHGTFTVETTTNGAWLIPIPMGERVKYPTTREEANVRMHAVTITINRLRNETRDRRNFQSNTEQWHLKNYIHDLSKVLEKRLFPVGR
jgi:hypothetical protein